MAENKTPAVRTDTGFKPVKFLKETQVEMKKVSWPNQKELVNYTCVVGIAVLIVCALIWLCDTFFARLFFLILK